VTPDHIGEEASKEVIRLIESGTEAKMAGELYASLGEQDRVLVLGALKSIKTDSAGLFLNLVFPQEKAKSLKKEIRRLLFRLRSAGVAVEEIPADGESVLRNTEEVRTHTAFLSNYDPAATRVIVLALEMRHNIFAFFHAVTHFSEGLQELSSSALKRRDVDQILEEYRTFIGEPLSLVEVSPAYAALLLGEASALSGRYSDDVKQISRFTARGGGTPGDRRETVCSLPLDDPVEPLPPEVIFRDHLFESFILKWATQEEDAKTYRAIEGSTIVLPGYMVREKREGFIKAFLNRDDFRPIVDGMKRLMEDYAYMFYKLGRFGAYRGLVEALQNPQFPGEAVLFFIKRQLDAEESAEEAPEPRLIVSPYEQIRR
jgi:hypothetical protein